MDPYRSFLIGISNDLTTDDLKKLIFVLGVPHGEAEKMKSPIDLFQFLERRSDLQRDKYDILIQALQTIGRGDLVERIKQYIKGHTGLSKSDSGGPRAHGDGQLCQDFCEKDGYRVKVVPGDHFNHNNSDFVQLKIGNKFQVQLSNDHNHGCVMNISFSKRNGAREEKSDIELGPCQYDISIGASFSYEDDSSSGSILDLQYLRVECSPVGSVISFQVRKPALESNLCCYILSEIKEVCIPKENEVKVYEVLDRLRKKHGDVPGCCFYNGHNILQENDDLQLKDLNRANPLLLLNQTEKIAVHVQRRDGSETKHINVVLQPLCSVHDIEELICKSFQLDSDFSWHIAVEGKDIKQVGMDFLKGKYIEVTMGPAKELFQSQSIARDFAHRGIDRSVFYDESSGTRGFHHGVEFDDLLDLPDSLLQEQKMHIKPQGGLSGITLPCETASDSSTANASPPTSQALVASSDVLTQPEAARPKITTCPDDKVVIMIYIVPIRKTSHWNLRKFLH